MSEKVVGVCKIMWWGIISVLNFRGKGVGELWMGCRWVYEMWEGLIGFLDLNLVLGLNVVVNLGVIKGGRFDYGFGGVKVLG